MVVAVAAIIAAALIGGAVIWAVSDDETAREAALESPTRSAASSHTVTMPNQNGGQPIGLDNYSIGATTAPAKSADAQPRVVYGQLEFARPLDALSLQFFDAAAKGAAQGNVRLEVKGSSSSTGKPVTFMRYDLGTTLVARGDEAAPGATPTSGTQAIGLEYQTLQLQLTPEMQYAPATDSVGSLEIPGVAAVSGTPAYLLGFSWGWKSEPASELTKARLFSVNSITIDRALDRHAAWFWQELVTGNATPQMTVRLEGTSSTGKPAAYMTYVLSTVRVSSVRDSGDGAALRQQIKLDFNRIELQSATGQKAQYDPAAALG